MNETTKQFDKQLPDLLKSWEIALRSGYSVMQIMEATAKMTRTQRQIDPESENSVLHIMESVPYTDIQPAAAEFGRVYQDVLDGASFFDALDDLLARLPTESLHLLVETMRAQREVGGNLADILQVIALVIRRSQPG